MWPDKSRANLKLIRLVPLILGDDHASKILFIS